MTDKEKAYVDFNLEEKEKIFHAIKSKQINAPPIFEKIVNQVDNFQEFDDAILGKEIPAIKLSSNEIEQIKGGQTKQVRWDSSTIRSIIIL